MSEEWRDVIGWEGVYQVSNSGNVRTVQHEYLRRGRICLANSHLCKQVLDKDGYARVHLRYNGKSSTVPVHRLVAIAFIPNELNFPMINHKDEDKLNNNVYNLEWCDATYNNNYGCRSKKASEALRNRSDTSKRVSQYDTNGVLIRIYPSLKEIKRIFGYDPSFMRNACNGMHKTAYGYVWKFN